MPDPDGSSFETIQQSRVYVLRRAGHFPGFLIAGAASACPRFSCGRRPCFPALSALGAFFSTLPLPLPLSPMIALPGSLTGGYSAHERNPTDEAPARIR